MSDGPANLLDAARWYLARGYAPIPVPAGTKVPVLKGWTDLRLAEADLPQYFNGTGNIGVLLGEPSGWLVDVDLDCEEAVALAPAFLPPTGAKSGRPGKPSSHWWYVCEGAKTRKHQDPVTKKMIVELRSTGAQTIVGPSMHPCGEPYDPLEGEPAVVDVETLGAAVAALARAVTEQRHGRKETIVSQPRPLGNDRFLATDAILRRAEAYLDRIPPAISGSGGHGQTYAAATAMVHGFGLDAETALGLLLERYKATGVPETLKQAAEWWGSFKPGGNLAPEHPQPIVVEATPEAGAVFDALAAMVDAELDKPDEAGRSLWARAEEKACRLALIYACSANAPKPVIDEDAARWACDLSSYLTRRMLYIAHEWVADGVFDARQKRVVRVVRKAGGKISRSELCRKTQWLTQRERQEVIDNLLETQQLRQEEESTATRPRVWYVLA